MGKPTDKMVQLAKKIASDQGLSLPKGYDTTFEICKGFIDDNIQNGGGRTFPPSEKQIEYAKRLEERTGKKIPSDALSDSKALSEYIDKANSLPSYTLSEKQLNVFSRNKESLDESVQELLDRGGKYTKEEFDLLKKALDYLFTEMGPRSGGGSDNRTYSLSDKQVAILANTKNANLVSKRVKELVAKGELTKDELLECKEALNKIFENMPPRA